jgi:hypothetical protein
MAIVSQPPQADATIFAENWSRAAAFGHASGCLGGFAASGCRLGVSDVSKASVSSFGFSDVRYIGHRRTLSDIANMALI